MEDEAKERKLMRKLKDHQIIKQITQQ